jgi:hypothetical protein
MRAKFRVSSIKDQGFTKPAVEGPEGQPASFQKQSERLVFDAVYSADPNSENKVWATATPYGHLEMQVDNPKAWGHFTVGQELYLDFIPVAQPVA